MAGNAVLQRQPGREHGAAHRQPTAPHQGRTHRQANAALFSGREFAAAVGLVITALVHQLQPAAGGWQWAMQLGRTGQIQPQQPIVQQLKLGHRKAMLAGQGRRIVAVVNQRRPHGRSSRCLPMTCLPMTCLQMPLVNMSWLPMPLLPMPWLPVPWLPVQWVPVQWVPVQWVPIKACLLTSATSF